MWFKIFTQIICVIYFNAVPQAPVIPPDLSAPYGLNRFSLKAGDHLTNITLRNDFGYSGVSETHTHTHAHTHTCTHAHTQSLVYI